MYDAAVFDMDGLLLDSERPIRDAWFQVMRNNGIEFSESVYLEVVGRNHADSNAILTNHLGGASTFDKVCAQVNALLLERCETAGYRTKPGAVELLSLLRERRIPLCVASSTNRLEVRRRLQKSGLHHFFDAIAGGDEVLIGKPGPDLFLLAAQRLGIAPSRCLVFEDSEHGAIGAMAAGMSAVLVPDLKQPSASVEEKCSTVLQSLMQALPLCESWFPLPTASGNKRYNSPANTC
jgi:HAD superfamily hydrolase (TIGR01509 family)